MTQQRLIKAMDRIERALSLLENASYQPNGNAPDNIDLQARHDLLKTEAQAAIHAIDALLEQGMADG